MGPRTAPTPLEVAASWLFGTDPAAPPLPATDRRGDPGAVLEQVVLEAVARPPCLVAFSGGRDSSAVLAVAAAAARREGLPLPVPVSIRPRGGGAFDESGWQELVVGHLRLPDWERLEVEDELDVLGPAARPVLRRHGLLYPPTFTVLAVLLDRVAGRSLLTGIGGDAYFGGWRLADLGESFAGRPRPRAALAAGYALLPREARARGLRRLAPRLPWLRAEAQRRVVEQWARDEAGQPRAWDRQIAWRFRLRRMRAVGEMSRAVAAGAGVEAASPLDDPRFLAALAGAGGRTGFGGRQAVMRALFSGLLPDPVLDRRGKASATAWLFRGPARAFASRWDGSGVDETLVDPSALRTGWLGPRPDARSALLLQSAWLAQEGAGPGERGAGGAPC